MKHKRIKFAHTLRPKYVVAALREFKRQLNNKSEDKLTENELRIEIGKQTHQCDQIGRFIGLWATFQSHSNILFAQISNIFRQF